MEFVASLKQLGKFLEDLIRSTYFSQCGWGCGGVGVGGLVERGALVD